MPSPNQTVCGPAARARSLRADQAAVHLGDRGTHRALLRVEYRELLLDRLMQSAQVRAGDRTAHRYEHVRAGLDQHAVVDRQIHCSMGRCFVGQNSRHERRSAVEPVRQQSERALDALRDDTGHAGYFGEDLKREQHFEIHLCASPIAPII
jgi:hypothetical protein